MDDGSDEAAIRRLVLHHFEPMAWDEAGQMPDWTRFGEDFLTGAVLVPAARPAAARDLEGFIGRMETVRKDVLSSFEEHTTGVRVLRFGNVAVALGASRMLENGETENHDVSAYLLVRTEGAWKIAAHAWDKAAPEDIPRELASADPA